MTFMRLSNTPDTGKVSNRDARSRLQMYRGVDPARIQWLTVEQAWPRPTLFRGEKNEMFRV